MAPGRRDCRCDVCSLSPHAVTHTLQTGAPPGLCGDLLGPLTCPPSLGAGGFSQVLARELQKSILMNFGQNSQIPFSRRPSMFPGRTCEAISALTAQWPCGVSGCFGWDAALSHLD